MKANLLFDLDGTLSDPFEGFAKSMRESFDALGLPAPNDAQLRAMIGPPIEQGMSDLLGTHDAALVNEAIRLYRQRYSRIGLYENTLYPGIRDALVALSDHGARLYLATSKPLVFASRIIEHFGLATLFSGQYGSELDGRLSNKSELIAHLLKSQGLRAEDCRMTGDRLHDVTGALNNGIRPLAVLWGYGTREELASAGAQQFCERPSELVNALMQD